MSPSPARRGLSTPCGLDDSDAVHVARARAGDRQAFEELVRLHADHMYAVVRGLGVPRAAAEDVTQEAFLRAWRGWVGFKGEARFSTWMYRIAVNEAKRWLRHERLRPPGRTMHHDEGAPEPADERMEPHARAAQAELRQALRRAVRRLPLKYRAPLILRDVEGLSTAEAAAILGIGEAAFKSRLHRARLAVRDHVAEPET
jgi:RNA polymerase sigma-70 factor (ECF subfamily)